MKAQVSIEFITFVSILLLITLVASQAAIYRSNEIMTENRNNEAKRTAQIAATELNIAYEIGNGYSRTFYLSPVFSDGADYSIAIINQSLYIFWDNRNYFLPILASGVSGNLTKGYNKIKNNNGVVEIA